MVYGGLQSELIPKYNIFLNQDDYLIEQNSDFILHYAGSKKPYFHNVGKYQYLWDIHNHSNVFDIGKKLLENKAISYNESNFHDGFIGCQPFYYYLAGFVNKHNISNIIEIGTHKGGSTLSFLNGINTNDYKILTIDIKDYELAKKRLDGNKNIIRLIGSADDEIILQKYTETIKNMDDNVLLFIDTLESGKWIEKLIKLYYCKQIKYILLDDITIDNNMKLWWLIFHKKVGGINIKKYVTESTKNGLGFIDCTNSLFKKYIQLDNPTKKYAVMWASTVNIGDDIQTLAAINLLKKKGITEYIFIDRELLSDYNGDPVTLIMNGWYMHNINKFPPSDKITPVFISVHIND